MDRTEMKNDHSPIHGRITGPIVMIGFGSIGKGMLPLIERHFKVDKNRFTVIDPSNEDRSMLDLRGIRCLIPGFDGAVFSPEWKDALWVRFTMGAPQRQRRSVERYSIVKRA